MTPWSQIQDGYGSVTGHTIPAGTGEPESTNPRFCASNRAHDDSLYTPAWIAFLVRELSNRRRRRWSVSEARASCSGGFTGLTYRTRARSSRVTETLGVRASAAYNRTVAVRAPRRASASRGSRLPARQVMDDSWTRDARRPSGRVFRIGTEAEYVDTPLLTNRLHFRGELSARMSGTRGVYRTWVRPGGSLHNCSCSCGAESMPCKHVVALEETWRINPVSFLDLDEFLATLAEKSKEQLLEMFGQLVLRWPAILGILQVSGFHRNLDEEDDLLGED